MLSPDMFTDNSMASASGSASAAVATVAPDASASPVPAVGNDHPVDVVDRELLDSTSRHAYQVIWTKLWRYRQEHGRVRRRESVEDMERLPKRRRPTTPSMAVAPQLIRKFEQKTGNMVHVVVKVQANDGEFLMDRADMGGVAGVEISKPTHHSVRRTLTKLLDSSASQPRPNLTEGWSHGLDESRIGRSTPKSIPTPRSPTPARAPFSMTHDDEHEGYAEMNAEMDAEMDAEIDAEIDAEMDASSMISGALSHHIGIKQNATRDASVQVMESGEDGGEGGFENKDAAADHKETLHERQRKASEASLDSMVNTTSSATSVILIGSVSGPPKKWEPQRNEVAAESSQQRIDMDRRASSITVDWENWKQVVTGAGNVVGGKVTSAICAPTHSIFVMTVYDCEPTVEGEKIAPVETKQFSPPEEILTPIHAASPDVNASTTPPAEMSSMDRDEQEPGAPVDAPPLHAFKKGAKLETIRDVSEDEESEGERLARAARRREKAKAGEDSNVEVSTSDDNGVSGRKLPILSRLATDLSSLRAEQEGREQKMCEVLHSPQVDFNLPADTSTFDISLRSDRPTAMPATPATPISPSRPSTAVAMLSRSTSSSSRPQSRQSSRPSSRHRHYSSSCTLAAPPVPPRSPHRKSMPSLTMATESNVNDASQSGLSQMLNFGENFLSRAVETDRENEGIWEKRREEVMEPLVGSPPPLPGCLSGASLCGEGVFVATGPTMRRLASLASL